MPLAQVKLVNDTPYNGYPTPAGNYRDAVNGVNWAAFAMSVVQLIAIGLAFRIKDDDVPDDKLSGEMVSVLGGGGGVTACTWRMRIEKCCRTVMLGCSGSPVV